MPIVHRQVPFRNLAQYRVFINDTGSNASTYFALSQVPDILTAGKNFFLIAGTDFLVPTTEVLIEIIDAGGNPVYQSPQKSYLEGESRALSIEVYNDTKPGPATLTILGQISQTITGQIPSPEFQTSYNVKYQRQLQINPVAQNVSPIRTYVFPTASVSERLVAYSDSSHSIQTINSGVIAGIATGVNNSNILNYYAIQLSNSPSQSFSNEMVGGTLLANINGTSFTSSVIKVLNRNILYVNMGLTGSNQSYQQFTTNTYSINYTSSASLTATQYTRSYSDVMISNLDTFVGNIYRAKLFVAPQDSPTAFEQVDDTKIRALELTVTRSAQNLLTQIGYVKKQSDVSTNFKYGFIENSASYFG